MLRIAIFPETCYLYYSEVSADSRVTENPPAPIQVSKQSEVIYELSYHSGQSQG